jgi:predicted DNA-binding protein YlxM (UPF0122 family)
MNADLVRLVIDTLGAIVLAVVGAKWIWSWAGKKITLGSKEKVLESTQALALALREMDSEKEEATRVERALTTQIKRMEETLAKHEARLKLLEEERVQLVMQAAKLEAELTAERRENKRLNESLARLRSRLKSDEE